MQFLLVIPLVVLGLTLGSPPGAQAFEYPPGAQAFEYTPLVHVVVLVRNKAHSLPWFLSSLQNLSYPKSRLVLKFFTDYNEDVSERILTDWQIRNGDIYYGVAVEHWDNATGPMPNTTGPIDWNEQHMSNVITLREHALVRAREQNADFIFMLDADVFLTFSSTLEYLMSKRHTVTAPMLLSEGLYSNFWGGMSEYYYKRTDDYKQILQREQVGCFQVPMVHSAVLTDLRDRKTEFFTYNSEKLPSYDGPRDDIITFASSVKFSETEMFVCNEKVFGFVQMPLTGNDAWRQMERVALSHVLLEALALNEEIPLDPSMEYCKPPLPSYPPLKVEHVYLINLKRREDRRKRMETSLKELGIVAELIEAVDGNYVDIDDSHVTLMPSYEDPYHKRPMKMGEIGCFLSHFYIWLDMINKNYSEALILEDDVRFEPHFRQRIYTLLEEVMYLEWDLLYIGRKVLTDNEEPMTMHTVKPSYTYWTLGYILRQSGARKLVDAKPLNNLLPVDEFLPIMFNEHPNAGWKSYFPNRNLVALSAAPLLVTPTHYTGQPGYVSDTEDSPVISAIDPDRPSFAPSPMVHHEF